MSLVQAAVGSLADFVFMDQGGVSQGFAFEPMATESNRLQSRFYCVFHLFPFFVDEGALRRFFNSAAHFDASESTSSPLVNWLESRFSEFTSTKLTDRV